MYYNVIVYLRHKKYHDTKLIIGVMLVQNCSLDTFFLLSTRLASTSHTNLLFPCDSLTCTWVIDVLDNLILSTTTNLILMENTLLNTLLNAESDKYTFLITS